MIKIKLTLFISVILLKALKYGHINIVIYFHSSSSKKWLIAIFFPALWAILAIRRGTGSKQLNLERDG